MVSSISRNWISGLSSGMDTQSMIDKIMQAEKYPLNQLSGKRSILQFQKTMLQEVNLKLFDLQSKSTDLTFSKAFSSKKITSTNESLITATATTAAKVGSYSVVIKQLATASKISSAYGVTGNLEYGQHLKSLSTIGGANLTLGGAGVALGVTPGDLTVDVSGGPGPQTLTLGLNVNSSVTNTVNAINTQINANANLKGKLTASYDVKTDQIKLSSLDTTKTITVADAGGGTIMTTLFGSASETLDNLNTVSASTFGFIHSGSSTTLKDLNITTGNIRISRGGGPLTSINTGAILNTTKLSDVLETMNHRIDTAFGWTGNPSARQIEFRYDTSSQRLVLANKSTSSATNFTVQDQAGNFSTTMFGAGVIASSNDSGVTLANETFRSSVSGGIFTIDGTQIGVNSTTDSLTTILGRITALSDVNATYDASRDVIQLTRKDGSQSAIALGSATDTSNFLSVTGLTTGSQKGAATLGSATVIGTAAINPNAAMNGQPFTPTVTVPAPPLQGVLRVTVNGSTVYNVNYLRTETLNTVLDRIKALDGVADAYYDSATRKVTFTTDAKGAGASIKLEDVGANRLAQALNVNNTQVNGTEISSTIESAQPISGINSTVTLDKAGFISPISSGSFTINGVNFSIADPTKTTLTTLLQTITDNSKAGVTAEFDSINGRIMLTSKSTGNSSITFGSPTDTSNFLVASGLVQGNVSVGQNSVFNVKGISGGVDLIRATNDISDVITGVSFHLKGVTDANGQTVDVKADTVSARKSIDDFIKSYNDTMELVYKYMTDKHDYTLEPLTDEEKAALSKDEVAAFETKFKEGLLNGDSTLSSIRMRMRLDIGSVVNGLDKTLAQLADIGITTGVIGSSYLDTQKGLLKITDETKLTTALESSPEKISALFGNDSSTTANQGIARRLKNTLNEFTKSGGILTSRVGRSGSMGNSAMDSQITLINTQITKQQTRLQSREDQLIKQFADLESAMSRYQSQSTAFSQQLAQLTGSK